MSPSPSGRGQGCGVLKISFSTTKYKPVIPAQAGIHIPLYFLYLLPVVLLIFLTACGRNPNTSDDTGSISFKLQLSHPTTTSRAAAALPADICTDYGITTINVNVFNFKSSTTAEEKNRLRNRCNKSTFSVFGNAKIIADGAPMKTKNNKIKFIPKADDLEPVVGAASIIAKHCRNNSSDKEERKTWKKKEI